LDVRLLKLLRKKVFVTFQGDDIRTGEHAKQLDGYNTTMGVETNYYTPEVDAAKKIVLDSFQKHCDHLFYLNPDLGWMLPANKSTFMPYAHLDLREWVPRYEQRKRPLVVHAPSHRGFKGSQYVLSAVERLKTEGADFDFQLVEGVPFERAKEIYQEADILIDQLLAGWYGGLAVELMALGKPVIVYIRQKDLRFIPSQMAKELPFIQANPDTIYEVLRSTIGLPQKEREYRGRLGRKFVEAWHDPSNITANLISFYRRAEV